MADNTILVLAGLLANAVFCYGIPYGYCFSNPADGTISCDDSSGIVSPWYGIAENQESALRRDYRDLQAVQPNQLQYAQYLQYIPQAPQFRNLYSQPPETYRGVRESPQNAATSQAIQAPISRTVSTAVLGRATIPKISQGPPSTPIVYGIYPKQDPQNPISPRQLTYSDLYYYQPRMRQNNKPNQILMMKVPYTDVVNDEDENVSKASQENSTPIYYLLGLNNILSSRRNNKQFYAKSKKNTKNSVRDEKLDDVNQKAITAARQQEKLQNTLDQDLELEAVSQENFNKMHEKRENFNPESSASAEYLNSPVDQHPYNLSPEINVKGIKEQIPRARFTEKYNDQSSSIEYDDENDSWGSGPEYQKNIYEREDKIFNKDFPGINYEKFQEKRLTEDLPREYESNEKKIEILSNMQMADQKFDRFKKEAKHLEAEEMKKDEKPQGKNEKPRQIMRIEKTTSQIKKSDTITPFHTNSSTSTESSKPKIV